MAQPVLSPRPAPLPRVRVVYEVEPRDDLLLLDEDDMPENPLHHEALLLLELLLRAWAARAGRHVLVAYNLACRWDPADARTGVDPDLCVIEPPPPDLDTLGQLRLWEGHPPPWLGVEVVSGSTAPKDYLTAPVSYAQLGVRELWVFDPRREGPSNTGGPFVVQVWRRDGDRMERVYAGPGPAHSPELGAWLVVVDGGRRLRLADDVAGTSLWPTEAEAEALARAQETRRAAAAQAAREQAEARSEQAEARSEQAEARSEQAEARSEQAEAGQRREQTAREAAEQEVAELRRRLAELEAREPRR